MSLGSISIGAGHEKEYVPVDGVEVEASGELGLVGGAPGVDGGELEHRTG